MSFFCGKLQLRVTSHKGDGLQVRTGDTSCDGLDAEWSCRRIVHHSVFSGTHQISGLGTYVRRELVFLGEKSILLSLNSLRGVMVASVVRCFL